MVLTFSTAELANIVSMFRNLKTKLKHESPEAAWHRIVINFRLIYVSVTFAIQCSAFHVFLGQPIAIKFDRIYWRKRPFGDQSQPASKKHYSWYILV